jgi:hypothetical protein
LRYYRNYCDKRIIQKLLKQRFAAAVLDPWLSDVTPLTVTSAGSF